MFRPFVTFEGVEGSGKTTQLRRAGAYLEARGVPVVLTREPGGTRVGEAVRSLLLDPKTAGICTEAEFLLFSASRAQHLYEVVRPALLAGRAVLCDRFFDASVAYQGVARRLGPEKVLDISLQIVGEAVPWRTFWLDLDPKEALRRAHDRAAAPEAAEADRFELEALAFHEAVREGYVWSQRRSPERIVRIPAEGTPEEVFERLKPHLEELIANARCIVRNEP
jgi:dTMP kinase